MAISAIADKATTFDYTMLAVKDMRVQTIEDPKTHKRKVSAVLVNDEPLAVSDRFWTSLYARYGFNSAFFKYFDHAEVFTRISEVEKNDRMRLCIERTKDDRGVLTNKLMGVSNPKKPIVVFDELMDLLERYHGSEVTYHDGIVESTHTPRVGGGAFKVGADELVNRFLMATPIDGYGAPNLYLSMLRQVCSNGMVGYAKSFRSGLALGKAEDDVTPALTRALDGFNNDEGYAALRSRFENAAKSWCSVNEAMTLYKLLTKAYAQRAVNDNFDGTGAVNVRGYLGAPTAGGGVENAAESGVGSQLLVAFHRMTGDISQLYGLANLDALSVKRQKTLPTKCTVYDAINFATEVATHYGTASGSRSLQAWVGQLISEEFDLENTKQHFDSFADFHIKARLEGGLTGSQPVVCN